MTTARTAATDRRGPEPDEAAADTGASEAADRRLALAGSWTALAFIVTQSIVTVMWTVHPDPVPLLDRILVWPVVAHVIGVFVFTQRAVVHGRAVSALLPWSGLLVALLALPLGTWMLVGPAAGAVALVTRPRRMVAAGVVVALVYATALHRGGVSWPVVVMEVSLLTAIAVILLAFTRLVVLVDEVRRTREAAARAAVDAERHRISRDLHDLLGRTLAAVSLRTQAAQRLVDADPDRSRAQLDEVARLVADGQASLRALTRGETFVGLRRELDVARDLLDRLAVRSTFDVCDDFGPAMDRIGARVLRESITNMLKHSRPTTVTVTVARTGAASDLVIVNDGAPSRLVDRGGTGLADVSRRVTALGGRITTGLTDPGVYEVRVRIPDTHADTDEGTP